MFFSVDVTGRAGAFTNAHEYPIYPIDFFNLPFENSSPATAPRTSTPASSVKRPEAEKGGEESVASKFKTIGKLFFGKPEFVDKALLKISELTSPGLARHL